jgi:chromate transporter
VIENDKALATLVLVFAPLSLISIGGGPSVFAEMQRQAVVVHGWMTQREFTDLFAISRVAPGPGALLTTLIGWKVAGWTGAFVVSLAFFLPSSLLAYGAARIWNRWRGCTWHTAVETGLAPIASGLVLAGGFAILQSETANFLSRGTAFAVAASRIWLPNAHPLALLGIGAGVFTIAASVG